MCSKFAGSGVAFSPRKAVKGNRSSIFFYIIFMAFVSFWLKDRTWEECGIVSHRVKLPRVTLRGKLATHQQPNNPQNQQIDTDIVTF